MTTNLYVSWETPYLPAVAGLTVEAWAASLFTHSPVGNPSAYPPAPTPTATTTTDASGNCELTGLTVATDYFVSIIDQNNKPWFQSCPAAYLGNASTSRRRWSINQGPVPAPAPLVVAGTPANNQVVTWYAAGNEALWETPLITFSSLTTPILSGGYRKNTTGKPLFFVASWEFALPGSGETAGDVLEGNISLSADGITLLAALSTAEFVTSPSASGTIIRTVSFMVPSNYYWQWDWGSTKVLYQNAFALVQAG